MILTPEDFAAVAVYETQLLTAVRSKYLRNVGRSGLAILVPIYERVKGCKYPVNHNCAACILGFLQRIGAIYFADKAEQEQKTMDSVSEPAAMPGADTRRRRRPKPKNNAMMPA